MLDGENRWGFVRTQIDRFGMTRYRLVVYPPGISDTERRQLRVWRGAPLWGTAMWISAVILLQHVTGSWTAVAIATALVAAFAYVAMAKAGDTRTQVRAMGVVTMAGHTDSTLMAARDELLSMGTALTAADERLDEGSLSPLEHEALWWQVYDTLAPARSGANARKMPH